MGNQVEVKKPKIIAKKNWNLDDLLAYLLKEGAELGQDNDGQYVIYTNTTSDGEGNLIKMPDEV